MSKKELLQSLWSEGKISRRDFMAGATALGLTAVSATALMSNSAQAATPKSGGRYRMGIGHGSTTDSFNPATYENGFATNLVFTHMNHLTEVNNDGGLIPELAASWEPSSDARTWTFKLRKGVEFHNGKTMDADDVLASINHHRGKDTKSGAKGILNPIEAIKKDGNDTIVFSLKDGNADFPFLVSDYHLAIFPSKDDKIIWEGGIGTGPYKVEKYEPGVRAYLTKNKNYWKEGRGHFDEVEMLSIIDGNARQNALTTGEVDAIDRVDTKTVRLLARVKGVNIQEATGTLHYTFPMDTRVKPFDNVDVRLALKYAMDRDDILKKVLHGHGALGNDHPISTSDRYHASGLAQRTYDIDKAKFHLKKAGAEGLTVNLSAADAAFGGAVDAAVLYKEHAAKAGITINLIREPNDGYWSNVWMKKPWCVCYWGGRPTADWMFSTAYAGGADWNDTFWKNDKFDKLLSAARAELDEGNRAAMYAEMQGIVHNDGGVVIPMFANHIHGLSDKLAHDEKVAGNWEMDGSKSAERWWFA